MPYADLSKRQECKDRWYSKQGPEYFRQYYQKNKPRILARTRVYYALVKDDLNRRRRTEPEEIRKAKHINLKSRYGITIEQYEDLERAQRGMCAICETKPAKLYVDHRHMDGAVRALLCPKCNVIVGVLETSPVAEKAKAYLEKYK